MRQLIQTLLGVVCAVAVSGCTGGGSGDFKPAKQLPPVAHAEPAHDHDHSAGPHQGALVEIGNEEYHAELVINDAAHSLKLYLLGPDAKTAATTAATEVLITTEAGAALTLRPIAGSAEGQNSEFELGDEKTVHELAEAGFIHGTLVVKIGDKPYSADVDAHFTEESKHVHDAKPAEPATKTE
jgi:hypothetical protein